MLAEHEGEKAVPKSELWDKQDSIQRRNHVILLQKHCLLNYYMQGTSA